MNPATPQDGPRAHSSDCIFAEGKTIKHRLARWADHWAFWLVSALVIAAAFYLLVNPPYWR